MRSVPGPCVSAQSTNRRQLQYIPAAPVPHAHDMSESEDGDGSEDIRLRWAREDARQCECDRNRRSRRRKRTTKELIRENEKLRNKLLKSFLKKRSKIFDVTDSSSSR